MDAATTHASRTARTPRHDGDAADRRSLPSLFSDLLRHTTTLLHEEVELAKADVSEKAREAARATGAMAIGGAIAFAGFVVLLFAAAAALAPLLPPDVQLWLAPLIVGAIVLVIGLIALSSGRAKLKAADLRPSRTMDSLRTDQRMVKEHLQ